MSDLNSEVLICGQRMRLLALSTIKSKVSTVLIGAKIGRYLIIENPKVGGVPLKLDDETMWTVNFISKGHIYSFNTSVINSILRPVPLVFLRFPEEVEVAPLRSGKRYPVNIPAMISYQNPEDEATIMEKALVVDISIGGCLLGTAANIPMDALVSLDLHLNNETVVSNLQAEIRSSRGQGETFYLGLYFQGGNSPEQDQLKNLIDRIEKIAPEAIK